MLEARSSRVTKNTDSLVSSVRYCAAIGIALSIITGFGLRLYRPAADPPSWSYVYNTDEGHYSYNTHNKIKYGHWFVNEAKYGCVPPIQLREKWNDRAHGGVPCPGTRATVVPDLPEFPGELGPAWLAGCGQTSPGIAPPDRCASSAPGLWGCESPHVPPPGAARPSCQTRPGSCVGRPPV